MAEDALSHGPDDGGAEKNRERRCIEVFHRR